MDFFSIKGKPFFPTAYDLDSRFRLTRYADMKGRGCKPPQEVLTKFLEGIQDASEAEQNENINNPGIPRMGMFTWLFCYLFKIRMSLIFEGVGMDASVTPLRHYGLCMVHTSTFLYTLVDDPYMQGKYKKTLSIMFSFFIEEIK